MSTSCTTKCQNSFQFMGQPQTILLLTNPRIQSIKSWSKPTPEKRKSVTSQFGSTLNLARRPAGVIELKRPAKGAYVLAGQGSKHKDVANANRDMLSGNKAKTPVVKMTVLGLRIAIEASQHGS